MDVLKVSIDVVWIYGVRVREMEGGSRAREAKHMLVHKQETLSAYIVHKLNKNYNKLLRNKTIFNWN